MCDTTQLHHNYTMCDMVYSCVSTMHGVLPATLPDIESEIYVLLFQKNRVSGSKLYIKSTVHVYSEFCALN